MPSVAIICIAIVYSALIWSILDPTLEPHLLPVSFRFGHHGNFGQHCFCTCLLGDKCEKVGAIIILRINQSINRTFIAPISPAKPGSVARQPNQCSTAKLRKQVRNINRPWAVTVSMGGKAKSKRCVFRYFLKVAPEMAEQTDSRRLFQRDGAGHKSGKL